MSLEKRFRLLWALNILMVLVNGAFSFNNLFIHPAPWWSISINAIGFGGATFGIAICIRMTLLRREIRRLDRILELLDE